MVDYTEEVCDKKDGGGGVHGLDVDRVGSRLHTHTHTYMQHTHTHAYRHTNTHTNCQQVRSERFIRQIERIFDTSRTLHIQIDVAKHFTN